MNLALLCGRSLAYCAHPAAAWRRLSRPGRALLLGAYFGASFALTLATLALA